MSTPSPSARRGPLPTIAALLALLLTTGLVLLTAPTAAHAAPAAPEKAPPGGAWVRTGHFVPGMGKANVVLEPANPRGKIDPINDLTYGNVSDYQKLPPGRYTASVSSSAADPDADPLLSSSFEVKAGDARTVAVVGTADDPRLTLLTDDLTPPAANTANVRILSASEQADAVTVRALMGPTVADGAVLGQATAYKSVPSGPWTLALTSDAMSGATEQQVDIASGSVYTVVVVDSAKGGVELSVVTDAAGAAVAPKGGAETGLGGAAAALPSDSSAPTGLLLALGLALGLSAAAGAGFGVRRRVRVAGAGR